MTTTTPKPRRRIFYGWYILGVILLTGLFAGPTSQVFVGVLVRPIGEDTGWSATSIAAAVTIGGILSGVGAPLVGLLADRYSPRVLMTFGVVLMAASFFLIAAAPSVWVLVLGYTIARGIAQNLIAGVVPRVIVVNWFRRMRGRAIGLVGTAHPVGTFVLGPAALLIMSAGFGWRGVWVILGIAIIVFLVLPNALFIRRTPEEMGLLPDGDDAEGESGQAAIEASAREARESWTFREAVRTPSFVLIIISIVLTNYGGGGLPFHMPQYYADQGLREAIGFAAVSMFAISGAFANTLWGFLAERISERLLGIFTMLMGAALALGFQFVSHPAAAVGYGVLLGVAARGEGSILMILVANYYGIRSYGVISGLVQTALLGGLALGPFIMSVIRESTGSYHSVFYSAAVTFTIAAVLLGLAVKPKRPQHASTTATSTAGGA
ncbi:MAG: MFS transporter [Chloroflexi bacterium]|nr:MFS transporter [Chloroflexota bacterium]